MDRARSTNGPAPYIESMTQKVMSTNSEIQNQRQSPISRISNTHTAVNQTWIK